VSPGAVAIIAPIALGFAAQYGINPLLMGLMVIHGAQVGGFSPISIYGGISNTVVERAGLPLNEIATFLASLVVNAAVAILLFAVLGGRKLLQQRAPIREAEEVPHVHVAMPRGAPRPPATQGLMRRQSGGRRPETHRISWRRNCSASSAPLSGPSPPRPRCSARSSRSPCRSSKPGRASTLSASSPPWPVSSTIVDVSPFSTNGALVLASAQGVDRDVFFRKLLAYGALATVTAPIVVWLVFVVIG
jgi:hypothetical protein